MTAYELLRQARAELRELVRQAVANALQFTRFTRTSSSGARDAVAGHPTGPDEERYDYEVRRLQHFGFRSVPPADTLALRVAACGGATNGVTVAEDSQRYGPSDLEDGEVALFNTVDGLVILLDKNGTVRVRSAAGQKVELQGGERGIARLHDEVAASQAFATWLGQVEKALNTLSSGAVQPLSETFASAIGRINTASDQSTTG
jgi:phage gp45-like